VKENMVKPHGWLVPVS